MFSLDAPLQPAIDGFVDPENGEQQHTTHLNNVVIQIHRNTSIQQLIQLLGVHLTHTQDKRRSRATLLLAEVLTRLPDLKLNGETTHLLLTFFVERLKDGPSLAPCLKALTALLTLHAAIVSRDDTWDVVDALFALSPPIATLGQSLRKQCFELLRVVLRLSSSTATPLQARVLMEGFLTAMTGEKDPRNLLLCLNLASELLGAFAVDADLIRSFFDTTSCYFPITFRPPPNDPYGITSEQLVAALRAVFVAQDAMAKHVLPMVLEKLTRTTVPEMVVDMLDTLGFCCTRYPLNRLLTQFTPVATALYRYILHGENHVVIQTASATLRTVARAVSPPSKLPGMQALAWTKFVVFVVEQAMGDVRANAMDSMVSLRAATVLTGVASESAAGFSYVLETSLAYLLAQCSDAVASEAALACVVGLLDCINVDVDHTTPPLRPYVASIQTTLVHCLDDAAASSSNHRAQRLCVQGLCKLLLRPPSPLLDDAAVHALLDLWIHVVLSHPSADVRAEAAAALRATATKSTLFAQLVLARCLPPLMAVVASPQPEVASGRSAAALLKDVLAVVTQLANNEPTICTALLLPLCRLALGDDTTTPRHEYAGDVMAAVAAIVRGSTARVACMDFCVLAAGDVDASPVRLLVTTLVTRVRHGAADDDIQPFINPTADILGLVMQYASPPAQIALVLQVLSLFLTMDVTPLRSDATLAHLQLMPLLASTLYSSGAALPAIASELPTLLPRLFQLAQRPAPSHPVAHAAVTGALKSIAALLNAMPDDTLLQHYLDHLTSTAAPAGDDSYSIAYIVQDTTQPMATRLTALQIYLFATKAVVLRAHATYVPVMMTFLWSLLAADDLKLHVAQGFQLLLDDFPDLLTPACHATISPVHRQRTFTMVFPLMTASPPGTINMEKRVATLLVIAHTPQTILLPYLPDIVPLVVDALNLKVAPYAALLSHPALVIFKMCLREDLRMVQAYFSTLFPGLLWQCQHSPSAKDRMAALECVGSLASTKYELIHPYKESVIKSLLGPLDDRKRVVRQLAAKIRNQWSIL
ncbi:Aste57867_20197 [Aphanomyces stellatus]|uniref:MMS19 nucleotide excision repair protein n=1 Tax=Aphanomyces stellatus TaxID=120398 RepID=A0A485LEF2_9STRA|nr:hypothetical protein As57867_020131 [Aphanomyces stellatus]VFT96891.1 Aste57867_20197 [Aphanomyces stellatus]